MGVALPHTTREVMACRDTVPSRDLEREGTRISKDVPGHAPHPLPHTRHPLTHPSLTQGTPHSPLPHTRHPLTHPSLTQGTLSFTPPSHKVPPHSPLPHTRHPSLTPPSHKAPSHSPLPHTRHPFIHPSLTQGTPSLTPPSHKAPPHSPLTVHHRYTRYPLTLHPLEGLMAGEVAIVASGRSQQQDGDGAGPPGLRPLWRGWVQQTLSHHPAIINKLGTGGAERTYATLSRGGPLPHSQVVANGVRQDDHTPLALAQLAGSLHGHRQGRAARTTCRTGALSWPLPLTAAPPSLHPPPPPPLTTAPHPHCSPPLTTAPPLTAAPPPHRRAGLPL